MRTISTRLFPPLALLLLLLPVACEEAPPPVSTVEPPEAPVGRLEEVAHANTTLFIGPIQGLTSAWHRAPAETAVPLGTVVRLRQDAPPNARVEWVGAVEVARDRRGSIAECPLNELGIAEVSATCRLPNGITLKNGCTFDVVDVAVESIEVSTISIDTTPLLPGPSPTNEETMAYYFGGSIAHITEVGEGHYRTSIERSIPATVVVDPPAFAPLVEWRVDGVPINLGLRIDGRPALTTGNAPGEGWYFTTVGDHVVDAGPLDAENGILFSTYAVTITSHESGVDYLDDGAVTTFTAVTEPPGLESEIVWLSSTKYGSGIPIAGTGPSFTTTFDATWGNHEQWLGVRAGNDVFNQDDKEGACCLDDGSCRVIESSECDALGGDFQGLGRQCIDAGCGSLDQRINFTITQPSYTGCTDPGSDTIDPFFCDDLATGPMSGTALVWVVVSDVDGFEDGITSVQFGLEYDEGLGLGDWTGCTGGVETPTADWPASGSGNFVMWDGCYVSPGRNAKIGFFTLDEADVELSMSARPDPRIGEVATTDCSVAERYLCPGHLDTITFSEGATPICIGAPCAGPPPEGACCLPDDSCEQMTFLDCNAAGGIYQGNNTECTPGLCDVPGEGACCIGPICLIRTEAQCALSNGDYLGDDTDCQDVECIDPTNEQRLNLFATMPSYSGCADPAVANLDGGTCNDLLSQALPTPMNLWVVLSELGGFANGVGGIQFGVGYDPGIDIPGFTICTGGSEIPTEGWPASGTGNAVTWAGGCYQSPGENAKVGFFFVADSNDGDFLQIINDPRVDDVLTANCFSLKNVVCVDGLGGFEFGTVNAPVCGEVQCVEP